MTDIYFAAAIRAGRLDAALYAELVAILQRRATVLTEHVGGPLPEGGEDGVTDREIHDRDLGWLAGADAVVAEVSVPSLGVGYEVARALELGKPVLCLYRPAGGRRLSAMIAGAPGVEVTGYADLAGAEAAVARFLDRLEAGR